MSFSSTPLAHNRRLDQNKFLNKPGPSKRAASPPRTSYAYGAPTSGTRSPPKPASPVRDNETDPGSLTRYAQQKQREQFGSHPKLITQVKPPSIPATSVNIASAFNQAVVDNMQSNTPNASWASGSTTATKVPRSTSVEYEQSLTQTTRRLGGPPNKFGPRSAATTTRRALGKSSSSQLVVPDSQPEYADQSQDAANGRGKSPFDAAIDVVRRTAFYVRQRSTEPESANTTANGKDADPSYEYADEEQEFQAGGSKPRTNNAGKHRNRMSADNKAYRPSHSEEDDSDEDFEADGKTRRKKRSKKQAPGGPLSTLPVLSQSKRRKHASRSKNNLLDTEQNGSIVDEQDRSTEMNASHSGTTPPQPPPTRHPSAPPQEPGDMSVDLESLATIPEVIEERERSLSPLSPSRPFSVGAFFGSLVRWSYMTVIKVIVGLTYMIGKIFGILFDLGYKRPSRWATRSNTGPFLALGRSLLMLAFFLFMGYQIQGPLFRQLSRLSSSSYRAPSAPAGDVSELAIRLQTLEMALSGISQDNKQNRNKYEEESRINSELLSRIAALELRVQRESARAQDAEGKLTAATTRDIRNVQSRVELLDTQVQQKVLAPPSEPRVIKEGPANDEEARSKLKLLEDRVMGVEVGVKEALDIGKSAVKVSSGAGAAWWNKLATGTKSGLTIKSSDGQDVTSLIRHLVDSAASMYSKDAIARPDFALHSAGARVIPRRTSPSVEFSSPTVLGKMVDVVVGKPAALVGRPPVWALHHETHNGHCWPFEGSKGHLGVALAATVYISDITIDHVPIEVGFDPRTAPRDMDVWALVEGADNVLKLNTWREEKKQRHLESNDNQEEQLEDDEPERPSYLESSFIRIASFTYNIHASNHIQTFPVSPEIRELGIDFGITVLDVKSNWGYPDYTCLYRMRVHGEPRTKPPPPDAAELD